MAVPHNGKRPSPNTAVIGSRVGLDVLRDLLPTLASHEGRAIRLSYFSEIIAGTLAADRPSKEARVLHVHRSERADRLVEGLAELLRKPPADPLAAEVVAVPAKGVERWVTQRLSHVLGAAGDEDGVCANVRFPSPAALVAEAVADTDDSPGIDDNPWDRGRLLWRLLGVIDDCSHEPWAAALGTRRLTAAQHLAALFDSYGAHRPAMLRSWADGDDTDGAGIRLSDDLTWQAELWRRLRERIR